MAKQKSEGSKRSPKRCVICQRNEMMLDVPLLVAQGNDGICADCVEECHRTLRGEFAAMPGLEVLLENEPDLVRKKRIGLVTNHSAVTRDLTHAADYLLQEEVRIAALFGPEHGLRGDFADGAHVPTGADPLTGIPVYSLYGPHTKPTPEMLEGIDILLFDIQDVGSRFYTFLYTLSYIMEAAKEKGLEIIVLDRPNPINGVDVEGKILEKKCASFVGRYTIPIRYGLTVGELAQLFNTAFEIDADLAVVPLSGWGRGDFFDQTGLPWVPPSPNMPTPETALVYPGTCLIEGTNVSEGRGTAKPFEMIGSPWIEAERLADRLNEAELPGVRFRPAHFIPNVSKHAGESCHGIQLHVRDRSLFRPVRTGVFLLAALKSLYPDAFGWREPGENGLAYIDLLAGTDSLRLDLDRGASPAEICDAWDEEARSFEPLRESCMIYEE
ncbi:MAG: DUF1343 domain-containing protein [Armatimonadetes bacterium]|nr:DUF1343 domain-containing protein [Armatimonadota bacterium]